MVLAVVGAPPVGSAGRGCGCLSYDPAERRLERAIAAGEAPPTPPGNTTLTLVVTNQKLARRALQQLGRQVHASMSRAIQPFHSLVDGDVLYAATTNEVDNPQLDSVRLGVLASELAWDAVLSSVAAASTLDT